MESRGGKEPLDVHRGRFCMEGCGRKKIKKYDQCPQLADGEIVILLDGGVNGGYYCSGGALGVPKRLLV